MQRTLLKAPLLDDTVLAEEIALETQALSDGVARYRKLAREAVDRGEGAQLKPAERLLQHWFQTVEGFIADEQAAFRKGTPGVGRAIAGPVLAELRASELAVLTMHTVVSACMLEPGGVPLARLAGQVGTAVMAELNLSGLADIKKLTDIARRWKRLNPKRINWYSKKTLDDAWTGRKISVQVGAVLIGILIETASLDDYLEKFVPAFRRENRRRGRKTTGFLVMDEKAYRLIQEGHEARQHMRPRYLPMIVEPYRWSDDAQGGYVRIRTPLTSKPTPGQKAAIAAADKTQLYDGLHAVGAAPLRVNRFVLDALRQAWNEQKGGLLNVPHADARPRIPFPAGYRPDAPPRERWAGVDPEVKKRHKAESAAVRRENVKRKADREEFLLKLAVAEQFERYPRIWFPHQLDFRGRVYPIPAHLNIQGDDVARGLLEFAEAREPGDRGMWWIAVAAANAWGLDKVSFDERVAWTRGKLRDIDAMLADPIRVDWWHPVRDAKGRQVGGAEDPWQFLAACHALFDDEAAAHFPVKLDGTCNGLQHYAALSRDAKAAARVNMVPSSQPADVYGDVAAAIKPVVKADAAGSEAEFRYTRRGEAVTVRVRDLAGAVATMTDRPVVKQTVMTKTYGVTPIGAREQIFGRLRERGLEGPHLYDASRYLAQVVMDGIGQVCEGATRVMDWLRECASLIVETGQPVCWQTPIGMPVVQPYRSYRRHEVKTCLQSFILQSPEEDVPVKTTKQVNGVAPNYVHGLDAAHWMLTAVVCRDKGIDAVAVHDCFATHAATTDAMNRVLREQFVALHSRDLLGELVMFWRNRHPDIVFPDPPPRGDLDLSLVLEAPYFFS